MFFDKLLKGKTIKSATLGGYNEWLDVEFTDGTAVRFSPYGSYDMFSPITCITVKAIKESNRLV
jgi:hypothetical protein